MSGSFRRFKLLYMLYNFFNRKRLLHNLRAYRQLGIRKSYFSPVSSKSFGHIQPGKLAESRMNINTLESTPLFSQLDESSRNSLQTFDENGFAILHQFISHADADGINEEIDALLKKNEIGITNRNKIMFAIHKSQRLKCLGNNAALLQVLGALVDGDVTLFQSINFLQGSEQDTHSDSIHMTTYPLGGLLGVWIALEDITDENGPLHYYPGSHKLPYYLNKDYDNEGNAFLLGEKSYGAYEAMISEKTRGLEKKIFYAKKGDALIWHANLFHGGEKHLDKSKTRKSVVFHYFKQGVVCYHEITQRPALMMPA